MEASIIDGESQNVITNPITVRSVILPRKEKQYAHKYRSKIQLLYLVTRLGGKGHNAKNHFIITADVCFIIFLKMKTG